VDVLHPGRVAVLFEGGGAAVAAQVESTKALVGGVETDASVWDESRERQAASVGRTSFAPGEVRAFLSNHPAALVRPAAGVAYLPTRTEVETPQAVLALQERVRERFDPKAVLA
jgi:hypothetical protein